MQLQLTPSLHIPLTDKKRSVVGYCLVDPEDAWLSGRRWHLDDGGYPCSFVSNEGCRRLHRFLLDVPAGMVTDHINRNKLDNRRANLRVVPQRINALNSASSYVLNYEAGVCSNGHPKTALNMYIRKDRPGKWNCRLCRRERRRAASIAAGRARVNRWRAE